MRELNASPSSFEVNSTTLHAQKYALKSLTAVQHACCPPFLDHMYDDNRGKPYPKLAYDCPTRQAP